MLSFIRPFSKHRWAPNVKSCAEEIPRRARKVLIVKMLITPKRKHTRNLVLLLYEQTMARPQVTLEPRPTSFAAISPEWSGLGQWLPASWVSPWVPVSQSPYDTCFNRGATQLYMEGQNLEIKPERAVLPLPAIRSDLGEREREKKENKGGEGET